MQLSQSETYKNLARAYASECQARTRYEFAEYGARYNGLTALSQIIDKIAYQEFNHARMLYTFIQDASKENIENISISAGFPFKEKWDVEENLKLMAEDEAQEAKIYAKFEKIAEKEGFKEIAKLFADIRAVEKSHEKIFRALYNQMRDGTMYKREKPVTWECGACGYKATQNEAWEECPLCKAKRGVVLLKI